LLAEVTDVRQQLLRLPKPIPLFAEHRPEFRVPSYRLDLSGELLEQLGDFAQTYVDLVGCVTLRAERIESTLHGYLPG
jgi:hypothetical protein